MENQVQLDLGLHEPVIEGGLCLSHAVLRVYAQEYKKGPEITLVNKVISLGTQKANMAKKTTSKKVAKVADDTQALMDAIEGEFIVLEPQLDVKVQDVIPKAFCSCGFSLSMRFMTRPENMDKALTAAAVKLNNSVAGVFDDLAGVFSGVSPYATKD